VQFNIPPFPPNTKPPATGGFYFDGNLLLLDDDPVRKCAALEKISA